jgi:hypothetical protein
MWLDGLADLQEAFRTVILVVKSEPVCYNGPGSSD